MSNTTKSVYFSRLDEDDLFLLEALKKQRNFSKYIKKLIRADLQGSKKAVVNIPSQPVKPKLEKKILAEIPPSPVEDLPTNVPSKAEKARSLFGAR